MIFNFSNECGEINIVVTRLEPDKITFIFYVPIINILYIYI